MSIDPILLSARELLSKLQTTWAICGGYALDLFLGKTIRRHSDVDICVFEADREAIVRFMREGGWTIYEFCGMGKVHPLSAAEGSTGKHEGGVFRGAYLEEIVKTTNG